MDQKTKFLLSFSGSRKLSPGAQVVTRGVFLLVVSSQDMKRVASDGDKQLVICGSSQGLNCREVIQQVAAVPQPSH